MITVYGANTTLEDLRKVETVRPATAGSRWVGIQHGDLADAIRDEVAVRGWEVTEEAYAVGGKDGADLAGALGIKIKGWDGGSAFEGMGMSLGFLHSNARRRALRLTVGARIACCNNGMCTGEVIMRRQHDRSVNLIDDIEQAVDLFEQHAKALPNAITNMRETEVTPEQASEVLMAAGRNKLVGWATIGRVDEEYRNPTYAEHGKDTAWALLNAFTYAARPNINPVKQMQTYKEFGDIIMAVAA